MALISNYMIATNTPGKDLTLSPLVGQSLLVKKIMVSNGESGFATVEISKSTIGYYQIDGSNGNHLHFPQDVTTPTGTVMPVRDNIIDWLIKNTGFNGYPVGQGETFRVTANWTADARVAVVYETYGATDQLPSNQDGSRADIFHAILYGAVSGGYNSAGYHTYGKAINPVQFPQFPFGQPVPSNTQIELLGILGQEVKAVSGTASEYLYTDYLKLTRDRTVLFDEAKNGLLFEGAGANTANAVTLASGYSVIGNYSNIDAREPYVFVPGMQFAGGDELNVQVHTQEVTAAGTVTEADSYLGFIARIHQTG